MGWREKFGTKSIFEHQGHVECLRLDPGLKHVAVGVGEFQRHFRQCFLACRDGRAGDAARERYRHSEVDDAFDLAAARPHNAGKLFELTKDFGGLAKHDLAGGRGAHAARASLQQGEAEPFFKLPDLLTERGLRDVDLCGGTRKAARFDDLHEIAQMTKLHDRVPPRRFLGWLESRPPAPVRTAGPAGLQSCTVQGGSAPAKLSR